MHNYILAQKGQIIHQVSDAIAHLQQLALPAVLEHVILSDTSSLVLSHLHNYLTQASDSCWTGVIRFLDCLRLSHIEEIKNSIMMRIANRSDQPRRGWHSVNTTVWQLLAFSLFIGRAPKELAIDRA